MTDDGLADGRRVAELLASEVTGRDDAPLDRLAVTDAREVPDDESLHPDGALAYRIVLRPDGTGGDDALDLARVFVQPDRARIDVRAGLDALPDAARDAGLRVRPAPGRAIVFVESGAEVKGALDLLRSVARTALD